MPDVRDLHTLAASRHGLFTRNDARQRGYSRAAIARRLTSGEWLALSPLVLALNGAPADDRRAVQAAVLDAGEGAALSHQSAVALWGLPGFELLPAHVIRSRRGRSHRGPIGVWHTSTRLPAHHVTEVDGIAVTTPTRAVFDLSGRLHPKRFERLVETMWSRRLTDGPRLRRMLDELSEHGRPRLRTVREYLADRGPDHRPAESSLELRLNQILVDAGERPLDRQVDLGGDDSWIGRVDFLDRGVSLIVEVDSELYHGSELDRALDDERTRRLEAAGFRVLRVREADVWHRPAAVLAAVRDGRRKARSRNWNLSPQRAENGALG